MVTGSEGYKIRTIVCAGCGDTVTRRARPNQSYCSLPCYRINPRPQRRTGEERTCEQCGVGFYVHRCRVEIGDGRFCSLPCWNGHQGRNKTEHQCKSCGATFRWSPSRTSSGRRNVTYCSIPCRNADPEFKARLIAMQAAEQSRRTNRVEAIGYALLDSLRVDYEPQAPFNGKFTPDATVADARLVVQFDGDYWHDRKGMSIEPRILRRVALDHSQDAYIRACGWQVVRLWESDLKRDPEACAEKIRQHLRPPS